MDHPEGPVDTNIDGAAAYLNTTRRHIKHLIYTRRLTYYKVGGLVRLRYADLDTFLAANRVEAS